MTDWPKDVQAKIQSAVEWASYSGCEPIGGMGGTVPMHRHPTCPLCGGHEPEFNARFSRCFRTEEEALRIFGPEEKPSGIHVGHRDDCPFTVYA